MSNSKIIRDVLSSGKANGDVDLVIKDPDTPSPSAPMSPTIPDEKVVNALRSGNVSSEINRGVTVPHMTKEEL